MSASSGPDTSLDHNVTSAPGQLSLRETPDETRCTAVGRCDLQGEDQWSRRSRIESSRILKDLECLALMHLTAAQPSRAGPRVCSVGRGGTIMSLSMVSVSEFGRKRSCLT